MGPDRLRQLPRRAARHRHLPPGQPRIPVADRLDRKDEDGTETRLSRHASSAPTATPPWSTAWPCSAGASAASRPRPRCSASRVSMLIPEVDRLQADGQAARGHHGDRPRAHRHADAAQEGRGRQVRRVLRPRPRRPVARRPRHHRQHGARIRRHLRLLPDRRRRPSPTSRAPAAPTTASRWSRPTPRRRACGATRRRRTRSSPTRSSSTSATSCPSHRRPEAPAGPRARSTAPSPASRSRWRPSSRRPADIAKRYTVEGANFDLGHGDVVIAAITSCTNTSNPSVMIGAGLLARNAVAKGLTLEALGEDLARARLPGGRAEYLEKRRPAEAPRRARLQPRRLRLHHLHRQFRPAAGGDLEGDQRQRPRRRRRALGQPQLRGPREPGRAGELPRLAAAGRRLRAGRLDADRPHHRAARHGRGRPARLPEGHLALDAGDRRSSSRRNITSTLFKSPLRRRLRGRRALEGRRGHRGRDLSQWDSTSTYVQNPPYFEGMQKDAGAGDGHRRRPHPRPVPRLDHHRPHLAGRQHPGELARRAPTCRSTRSGCRTSTSTARGAATTKS